MACKLSEKQIIALAKYVTSALENAKPETLNPNFTMDLMKNLYDSIVAKTGDAVNALDYIQHIPTSILAVSGANPEYFTKLVGAGVDINKLTLTMKFRCSKHLPLLGHPHHITHEIPPKHYSL